VIGSTLRDAAQTKGRSGIAQNTARCRIAQEIVEDDVVLIGLCLPGMAFRLTNERRHPPLRRLEADHRSGLRGKSCRYDRSCEAGLFPEGSKFSTPSRAHRRSMATRMRSEWLRNHNEFRAGAMAPAVPGFSGRLMVADIKHQIFK